MVRQPLAATETTDKFDLLILADGGGVAGQAGAAVWAFPGHWWSSTRNCGHG